MSCIICFDKSDNVISCPNDHIICHVCFNSWFKHTLATVHKSVINIDGTVMCPKGDECSKNIGELERLIKYCDKETLATVTAQLMLKQLSHRDAHDRDEPQTSHVTRILELMNKKCPSCKRVFDEFDGCLSVSCDGINGCGQVFCGACFLPFADAHAHANMVHGNVFMSQEQLQVEHRKYFRKQFWEYISKHFENADYSKIIVEVRPHVIDILGTDFEHPKNRVPPYVSLPQVIQQPQEVIRQPQVQPLPTNDEMIAYFVTRKDELLEEIHKMEAPYVERNKAAREQLQPMLVKLDAEIKPLRDALDETKRGHPTYLHWKKHSIMVYEQNSTPENRSEMEKHLDNYKRSLKKSRDLNKAIDILREKVKEVYGDLDRINQMTPAEKDVRRRLMNEYEGIRINLQRY